jgi:phospholipid/cholesterol/gamma-HCH transport system substrate-binding protein
MTTSHKQLKAAFKVGLLTLVSLILLGSIVVWLQGRALQQGQTFAVLFSDVDGLRQGATVQMMGLRVGFVDEVTTDISDHKYAVRVKFTVLRSDVHIPKGSVLTIEQAGLVGEKFVEITPPRLQDALLLIKQPELVERVKTALPLPVKIAYQQGLMRVGQVELVEQDAHTTVDANKTARTVPAYRYRFLYRVVQPGTHIPPEPAYKLVFEPGEKPYLLLTSDAPSYVPDKAPVGQGLFTVDNPTRFKEFIAVQIASAEALKETNDRLNELLDDATIADIQGTMTNLKAVSGKMESVMNSADALFKTLQHDLEVLVNAADGLSGNLNVLSKNLNNLLGDPKLQADIKATATELRQATNNVNRLLADPSIQETLNNTAQVSRDFSAVSTNLKGTLADKKTQERLEHALQELDDSLGQMSSLLSQVKSITNEQDPALRGIVDDTRETTQNLKKFSQKLKGRFVLWRLLF